MSVFDYQKYGMSGSIYVDLNVIHTVPFNKANTGDDGCNKVGFLGGVPRGRFSSQSLYSVSYTHLDVYKRQPFKPISFTALDFSEAFPLEIYFGRLWLYKLEVLASFAVNPLALAMGI